MTYCGNELIDTVRRHTVEVREVELQVDLVVEHVLAQWAAQHGLDRVLCHDVHSKTVQVSVGKLAVGALVHLRRGGEKKSMEGKWAEVVMAREEELQIRGTSEAPFPSSRPVSDHRALGDTENLGTHLSSVKYHIDFSPFAQLVVQLQQKGSTNFNVI